MTKLERLEKLLAAAEERIYAITRRMDAGDLSPDTNIEYTTACNACKEARRPVTEARQKAARRQTQAWCDLMGRAR